MTRMHAKRKNILYLAIVVIFAVLVVAGFLNGAAEESMQQQITVTLDTTVEVRDNQLLIHYKIENQLSEPIYLVNRVSRWTRTGFSIDPSLVYTEIVNNTLRLTKAYIDVPENIDVEAPEVPFLTEVAGGSQFEECISQALPLEPYHPYNQVKRSEAVRMFESVQLAIGWLPSENISVRTVTKPEGLTLLSANYLEVAREQQLLVSNLNVKVSTHIQD